MRLCQSDRAGFSLIELVVVLLLMAIMASMATIGLQGVVIRGRLVRAAEVVEQFDTALRRQARNQRPRGRRRHRSRPATLDRRSVRQSIEIIFVAEKREGRRGLIRVTEVNRQTGDRSWPGATANREATP